MQKLIILYWGTIFLMYLSQTYCPAGALPRRGYLRSSHFLFQKTDIFLLITIIWLTCFSFLRTSYNDTETYIHIFSTTPGLDAIFADPDTYNVFDNPLSTLYRAFIRSLTDNYHIYFLFPALISMLAFVGIFKRYSTSLPLSLLIFFSLGTYITYLASLKQCIAMALLLFSLPHAIDKKYLSFLLIVILAALFHAYAIFFAVIPLLAEKPWGKVTWIMFGIMLFSMATYDQTLGQFITYVESLGAEMHEDEIFYDGQLNILRVLVYWIPAILALVCRRRLFVNSTRTDNLFVNISILGAMFLSLGLVKGANLMGRMAAYFEFATCIALPWMIKKIFEPKSAKFIMACAAILYFIYFYYEFAINKNFGTQYSAITFWQFIRELF